ncbi:MAG: hypothetical protein RL365_294 [Bacteroidota bacterium]|jgi:hypothetical protein
MFFSAPKNFYPIVKAAFIIGLPLVLLFSYNYSDFEWKIMGISIKKIYSAGDEGIEQSVKNEIYDKKISKKKRVAEIESLKKIIDEVDSSEIIDTSRKVATVSPHIVLYPEKSDSSEQRILLIGDSQAGGIMYALNDYCVENGHKLVGVFTWFSATAFNFGYSNKVDQLMTQFKPTLVVIVLGLNEMYARDIKQRASAANKLIAKLGTTPYIWVGPANYMEDYGINSVYEQAAGSDRFILSKHLTLPRSTDKRHPNRQGYRIWMDYIASRIQGSSLFPFNFRPPQKIGAKISGKVITANAAKDRGY